MKTTNQTTPHGASINLTINLHIDGADLGNLLERLLLALEANTAKK